MYLNQEKLRETKEKIHKTVGSDITAEYIAVAIHNMNPKLKALTVMEDIQKIKDGINYFSRIYDSKANSNEPIIDVIEKIEMSEMDDKQKAGCFGAMHLMLDLTKQDAQEVSAFAQKPISEQKLILINEIEEVADVIMGKLNCGNIIDFFKTNDAITPLSEEEMLLNASAIYYASKIGDMSDEFKHPEIIGICVAGNSVIINRCIETSTEHIDSENIKASVWDAVIQLVHNIIVAVFFAIMFWLILSTLIIPAIASGILLECGILVNIFGTLGVCAVALGCLITALGYPFENFDDILKIIKLWKEKKNSIGIEEAYKNDNTYNESNQLIVNPTPA